MKEIQCDKNYSYIFSRYLEPVATVEPGEPVAIYTKDAFADTLTGNDQLPSKVTPRFTNPQTGPIYIKGALPGDVLAIRILSITPTRDWAASCISLGLGGLHATGSTRMLNPPLPEKAYIYRFDGECYRYSDKLRFPCEPFIGTIATAPELEAIGSLSPFSQGGNMDVPDVKPGNTLYLPVAVEGAYFFLGDVHAKQGQGETCGTALEIAARVELCFEIIKNKKIRWPRLESDTHIMCIGSAKPMEDAARIAYCELVEWLEELGWEMDDAYQAVTQAGGLYVGNMVDTTYSLVASISKEVAYR